MNPLWLLLIVPVSMVMGLVVAYLSMVVWVELFWQK